MYLEEILQNEYQNENKSTIRSPTTFWFSKLNTRNKIFGYTIQTFKIKMIFHRS